MNVLHICSEYSNKSLYVNLLKALENKGVHQYVFIPIKHKKYIDNNKFSSSKVFFYYSKIISQLDRFLYLKKSFKIVRNIEKKINLKEIDFIHAHTLYTNGGPAYLLSKKYKIPYIITIRNTDVNLFLRYFLHTRRFVHKVMINAKKIIVLSPYYKQFILNRYITKDENKVSKKFVTIPNGIDDFWHSKVDKRIDINSNYLKLLYVGEFTKNKNIENIIRTSLLLINKGYQIQLTLIGNFGNYAKEINKIAKNYEFIRIIDKISDKQKLRTYYLRNDIFIMPSYHETFGLVYAEALSCGLPVIYSKNQGIDGYFYEGYIGYAVNPKSPLDISEKILLIKDNYNQISKNCKISSVIFKWNKIANTYISLYS